MSSVSTEIPFSQKIAKAGSLTVIGKLIGRGFDLITLAVLSRLLTPADFGLTALAMTSVIIAETVTSLPLVAALIRVPKPTRVMYDTAFTLAFLRGVLLAVVLGGLGFVMMTIYNEPRLVALVAALSLAPIMRGLVSPRMVLFMQKMNFLPEAGIEVVGKIVALIVSCSIAYSTQSYWAIAASTIMTPLVMNILSYSLAPYKPRFSLKEWALFKGYVGWNSLTQFISAFKWQMDRLLLGYFVPKAELGRYTMASDLTNMPMQAFVVPMGRPILASYSARGRKTNDELQKTYLKTSNAMFTLTGPLFMGLALLAIPAVRLVLGPNWTEAGELLQWIVFATLFTLPVINLNELALALDEARMLTIRAVIEFCIAAPAMLLGGLYYGVMGVIVARIISALVTLVVSMGAVRTLIDCSFARQFAVLWRPSLSLLVLAGSLWGLRPLINMDDSAFFLAVEIVGVAGVGMFAYLGSLFALWWGSGSPAGVEAMAWEKIRILLVRFKILSVH